MQKIKYILLTIAIFVLLVALAGIYKFNFSDNEIIDITNDFTSKPESKRLRYFKEIGMENVREDYNLTGDGVRVTIMGESVDPTHPDLAGRVHKQYNTYIQKNKLLEGNKNLPYNFEKLSVGDGHGTHIAGTIAASCDNIGIQGVACKSTLDIYTLSAYDEEDLSDIGKFLNAFSAALDHITKDNHSKITTGSFNIESPVISYRNVQNIYGKSTTEIVHQIIDQTNDFDDMLHQNIVTFKNQSDIKYIKSFQNSLNTDEFTLLILGSLLPFSKEWQELEQSIQRYQKSGGVYLVTESNLVFYRTSILNAMPSISKKVNKDLWLSIVMVQPKDIEKATSRDEFEHIIQKAEYITPINDCGEIAYEYCILTPSYDVLSTMTAKVRDPHDPIFTIEGRTYQAFGGHSMGAPMVAGALALMQEYNLKEGFGYTMVDLVRILKLSANRDFKGYDIKKHGQGILDVYNALKQMSKK